MDMKRVETIEDAMNWAKENSISPKANVDSGDIYFLIQTIKQQQEECERSKSFVENLRVVHFVELQREKATVKQQHTLLERYKEALESITHVGWSEAFGGGIQYSGESHGDCIKIARKALEGGGG